jgi:hypothetical protein
MKKLFLSLALAATSALTSHAETLVALTAGDFVTGNNLIFFDSATPGTPLGRIRVTGLSANETLQAFDYRPATSGLYALSDAGQLYVIDTTTAVATKVGPINPIPPADTHFGFDFNPTVDLIRITTDGDNNYRMNPNTAAVFIDSDLAYAAGDPNAGANPNVVGSAYTNSFPGALVTVLYDIDSSQDVLVIQNPPNAGTLNTVGPLGVDTADVVGFDISPVTGVFYATLTVSGSRSLYTINQLTGAATLVGAIGGTLGAETVIDIAAPPRSELANMSARGRVSHGEDVLIGGVIIRGGASRTLLVRALGPSLANFGVDEALADPVLTVYDRDGQVIAQNDNWQTSPQAAQITASGLAPQNPAESAVYGSAAPGSYTAVVSGKGNATGIAVVEFYTLGN